MIDGKQRRGGAASRTYNGGEVRGRDKGEGARLRTVGGGYRGGREKAGTGDGRQIGTTSEKVRRVGVVWVQLLARAYI